MQNRLEMLRLFVAAAEASSFKEAAVRLGTSPQAVTRAVQELERVQGELLFHRNTRQVRITAFGEQLAARARLGVQQLDELFASRPDREASELGGIVRVTAPKALGRIQVQPVLAEIASRHPQLCFDLHLSDVPADVVDEKIDIGVRFGFLRDSRYVARRVATHAFHVVGTPALIARVGRPSDISQLDDLPTTVMHDVSTGRPWPWLFARGQQFTPVHPAFSSNDSEAERDAVLAGLAFGQLAGFLADAHIAEGRLVPVLQEHAPDPWELYVYRPQRGPVPARIRLVYDQLVEALSVISDIPSTGSPRQGPKTRR